MANKTGARNAGLALIVLFLLGGFLYGAGTEIKEGLKSGTSRKKAQIIESIAGRRDKVYLPELGRVLSEEKSDEIRSMAANALLAIGDSTCTPYFRTALGDSYWQVRLYGVQGLGKYGEGNLIPDFKRAMKDSYWQVRYYAAVGLSKYGDETVLPDLLSYMSDSKEEVREKLLWAMLMLMGRDEARAMFKKFPENTIRPVFDSLSSKNTEIRIRSLWLLEASGDRRAIPHFVKMLSDDNDEIKIRALWALERFRSEDGGRDIEGLLVEESTKVRIESIKTLVNLKMEEGIGGIIKGLTDKNETVRIYSLWALEKFKNPVSYPAIAECLADSSEEVKEYAARLIEKTDDPLFYPVLQRFIEDKNFPLEARLSGLRILGKTGDGSVKDFIMQKFEESDAAVRHSAIKSMADLDIYNEDYLRTVTYFESYDSSPRVRSEASDILSAAVKGLREKLKSPSADDRKFAMDRVDCIAGAKALPGLLLEMASSKYPEVRQKMLVLVKENPDRIFAGSAKNLIKERDISIKKLAAIALGEIGDMEAVPLLKDGLRHPDSEFNVICARSLAKMGVKDGLPVAVRYLESGNPAYQKTAAETLAFLKDKNTSPLLLRRLAGSELDVKLVCAWALARMGEEKGLDFLVRLSEEAVEPVRTEANIYLADASIPLSLRSRVPALREKIHFEKLGIHEVTVRRMNAFKIKTPIDIDGSDKDVFWQMTEKADMFIEFEGDRIKSAVHTTAAVGYDEKNLYLVLVCDDPDISMVNLESRDIVTVSINPANSHREWYQFVVHPERHVEYYYIWMMYADNEPQRSWTADWNVKTAKESKRWIAEMSIPLSDLKSEGISAGAMWSINFQRESEHMPGTSWSGRIDNPEQFGILNFKE
ncbi:MAG: HEAT repeat domain-containing protein [Candidatus Omnitrophica bacterium]|nr:HEAT repeat domain-containing protein [Candidatus Omnitrophota bacterium]